MEGAGQRNTSNPSRSSVTAQSLFSGFLSPTAQVPEYKPSHSLFHEDPEHGCHLKLVKARSAPNKSIYLSRDVFLRLQRDKHCLSQTM